MWIRQAVQGLPRGLVGEVGVTLATPQAVLDFWFDELGSQRWFARSDAVDALITARFKTTYEAAAACELYVWRRNGLGRLAEIIVLDQFARNLFRDEARAFHADPLALGLAQEAVALGIDKDLNGPQRAFLYMPYMHSESSLIHQQAVTLFSAPGLEFNLAFELKHKAIIDRFGRYPHRNGVLNRVSTPEEVLFLQEPDSSF
jgi:uncharacterized protein (DUF924 family)